MLVFPQDREDKGLLSRVCRSRSEESFLSLAPCLVPLLPRAGRDREHRDANDYDVGWEVSSYCKKF